MKKHLLLAAIAAVMGVASASAEDVTVSLSPSNGTFNGLVWTSTTAPAVTISLSGGSFIQSNDGIQISTAGETRTVTISTPTGYCFVTSCSMKITGTQGDVVEVTDGTQTINTDATDQDFAISGIADGENLTFNITPSVAGQAKKIIIKDLSVTLSTKASGEVTYYDQISRDGWTINPFCCNETAGENGNIQNCIDGDVNTIWHSQYNGETHSAPHWFALDLGKQTEFSRIEMINRQSGSNGIATNLDIYVSADNSFADVTNDNASTYGTPTLSTTVSGGAKSAWTFDLGAQTARYILVVYRSSVGNFGSLAEFNLYNARIVDPVGAANSELNDFKANFINEINTIYNNGILYDGEAESIVDQINNIPSLTELSFASLASKKEEVENALYSRLSGRIITIQNARRCANGTPSYISVTSNNDIDACRSVNEYAKWMILSEGKTFKLLNVESRKYIGTGINNAVDSKDNAKAFHFISCKLYDNSVGIQFSDGTNSLNFHPTNAKLTSWSLDEGGAWYTRLAGVAPENIEHNPSVFYRIRSNRGMYGKDWYENENHPIAQGSLMTAASVLEDGIEPETEQVMQLGHDGLRALWTIEESADGRLYLRNAAAVYGDGPAYALQSNGNVGQTPLSIEIQKASEATIPESATAYNGRIPYAVAICTSPDAIDAGHLYLDVKNHSDHAGVVNGWYPNNDMFDNGSVYYFELAEDAIDMITDYVSHVAGTDLYQSVESIIENAKKAPAIWATDVVEECEKELNNLKFADLSTLTIAEANSLTYSTAEDAEAIVKTIYDSAIGRQVRFTNVERGSNDHLMAGVAEGVKSLTDALNLATIWTIQGTATPGAYTLLNHSINKCVGYNNTLNSTFPWSDDASEPYEFLPMDDTENRVAIRAINHKNDNNSCLHEANWSDHSIVRWNTNGGASKWNVSLFDDEAEDIIADCDFDKETGDLTVRLNHKTSAVAKTATLADHHVITIYAPEAEAAIATLALTEPVTVGAADVDDETEPGQSQFTVNLGTDAANGDYRITIPAGFFTVGGNKLAKGYDSYISLNSDGTVTGVEEIEAAEAAAQWYTIQGVRVAEPTVAGVYVRVVGNKATKVYVK